VSVDETRAEEAPDAFSPRSLTGRRPSDDGAPPRGCGTHTRAEAAARYLCPRKKGEERPLSRKPVATPVSPWRALRPSRPRTVSCGVLGGGSGSVGRNGAQVAMCSSLPRDGVPGARMRSGVGQRGRRADAPSRNRPATTHPNSDQGRRQSYTPTPLRSVPTHTGGRASCPTGTCGTGRPRLSSRPTYPGRTRRATPCDRVGVLATHRIRTITMRLSLY